MVGRGAVRDAVGGRTGDPRRTADMKTYADIAALTGIRDDELKTACQQACPTNALTFGSLHDPRTKVSLRHADPRRFDVLHELNTRPRTVYLTKIKNPNPELA